MIVSFKDKETEKVFNQSFSTKLPADIQKRAFFKLLSIHRCNKITDLSVNNGNRLESLSGNREGTYSIRINKQWRICFIPIDNWSNFIEVGIEEYH